MQPLHLVRAMTKKKAENAASVRVEVRVSKPTGSAATFVEFLEVGGSRPRGVRRRSDYDDLPKVRRASTARKLVNV